MGTCGICLKQAPCGYVQCRDCIATFGVQENPARFLLARASQAEQALATVAAERDEARAEVADRSAASDALSVVLGRDMAPAHEYVRKHQLGHVGNNVVQLIIDDADSLRARLAKTERVVAAVRAMSVSAGHGCDDVIHPGCWERCEAALRALDGHEVPAQNRQPVEPPSDPATGTTRREPPETDRQDGSTGAVAWRRCPEVYPGSGMQCLRQAGHDGLHTDEHEPPPATRAELEELRREVLETVAEALQMGCVGTEGGYRGFARAAAVLRKGLECGPRRVG